MARYRGFTAHCQEILENEIDTGQREHQDFGLGMDGEIALLVGKNGVQEYYANQMADFYLYPSLCSFCFFSLIRKFPEL